ncbi:ThuA domain-containing protein [Rhodopirellula sp. MGV]|uniref:ThuA domain-containing protein n=1 Tax=Rhodopirellula sp. MGV TaxID=2023130 RepID=UPI000B970DB1|nr:ThuA domain-containing protein [Rhodopirellula sp. MGV]OYP34561.1 hypothetical protein CGZ80_14315 [Rhodopirellula sp. MGV]PNY36724.1 hypothetical protein C2E31_11440 [Rhodopirellula baltica]
MKRSLFNLPSLLKQSLLTLLCLGLTTTSVAICHAESGVLEFPAKGDSHGKVVLVAGDEEYRTEESMPMLAKILSVHHGYDCVVLFSMSADQSYVDPNNSQGVVGWEQLDDADLMIIGTRFRQPSADDAAHVTKFIDAGKPVVGFRTATHAFNGSGNFGGKLSYGQFGLNILGEQWVNHHGQHKVEGARSVVADDQAEHPILRSVDSIFTPSDVYGVVHLSDDDQVLLRAAVTKSLDPESPNIEGSKNSPMQAFAWLHQYTSPGGATGRAFCTTGGASVDFVDEDLRRLIVNAVYFLTDRKIPAKTDVSFVDPYYPTFYGFIRDQDHWKNLAIQPSDFETGKAPHFPDPQGTPEWNFRERP